MSKNINVLPVTLSVNAAKLYERLLAGNFYRAYASDTPKAMKELEDKGLVGQCGRQAVTELCYVPVGYMPSDRERFPSTNEARKGYVVAGTLMSREPFTDEPVVHVRTKHSIEENGAEITYLGLPRSVTLSEFTSVWGEGSENLTHVIQSAIDAKGFWESERHRVDLVTNFADVTVADLVSHMVKRGADDQFIHDVLSYAQGVSDSRVKPLKDKNDASE